MFALYKATNPFLSIISQFVRVQNILMQMPLINILSEHCTMHFRRNASHSLHQQVDSEHLHRIKKTLN